MGSAMRFLADENFDGRVIVAIKDRADIMRVQDSALYQATDEEVLEYAATTKRVLLTHDKKTLIPSAYQRIAAELSMLGVLFLVKPFEIGVIIRDLEFIIQIDEPEYFENKVLKLPVFES